MEIVQDLETLGMEIRSIQILDGKIENHTIYSEECYYIPELSVKYDIDVLDNLTENHVDECITELEDVVENGDSYTYDDIMEEIISKTDIYYLIYDLPEMSITNKEWDSLFQTLAFYYMKHDFRYSFGDDMIYLNKLSLARSLVYEQDSIDFDTYVSSLKYLESKYLTTDHIKEIVEILGKQVNRNLLPLISNNKGKIESLANIEPCMLLDSTYNNLNDEEIRRRLKKEEEYDGDNYAKILYTKDKQIKEEKSNIVDFKKYVKTRYKK